MHPLSVHLADLKYLITYDLEILTYGNWVARVAWMRLVRCLSLLHVYQISLQLKDMKISNFTKHLVYESLAI